MTIRQKTIEYGFNPVTGLNSGATITIIDQAINIPEIAGRVFRSVFLRVFTRDSATTANTITQWSATTTVGGVTTAANTVATTLANTAEAQSFEFTFDLTNDFVTNFGTGTSQTLKVDFSITGGPQLITGSQLVVTYDYDDVASTRIKTVRIPYDTMQKAVTTAAITKSLGMSLDAYLPEASKVYRSIYFEYITTNATISGTDQTFTSTVDVGGSNSVKSWFIENQLVSSNFLKLFHSDLAIASSSTCQTSFSVTGQNGGNVGIVLHVTYEYDHSASTSIFNSLLFALGDVPGYMATGSANFDRIQRTFMINEPGPITTKHSAVLATPSLSTSTQYYARVNSSGAFTLYQQEAGTQQCGCTPIMHRVDTNWTLARGENTLTYDFYGSGNFTSNWSACMYVNYTSGKHSDGDGVHNHTVIHMMSQLGVSSTSTTIAAIAPVIPESTSYWLTAAMIELSYNTSSSTAALLFQFKYNPDEVAGGGWQDIYNGYYASDAERSQTSSWMRLRSEFKRHANDPDLSRADIFSPRDWMYLTTAATSDAEIMYVTYHTIQKLAMGTITGFTGDGAGIDVDILRADTDELIYRTTTTTGGSFMVAMHDDTVGYYAVARESDTKVGRSANGNP